MFCASFLFNQMEISFEIILVGILQGILMGILMGALQVFFYLPIYTPHLSPHLYPHIFLTKLIPTFIPTIFSLYRHLYRHFLIKCSTLQFREIIKLKFRHFYIIIFYKHQHINRVICYFINDRNIVVRKNKCFINRIVIYI